MDLIRQVSPSVRTLPPTVLLKVATDRPAALLLIDLASRRIVHANALAAQLAPGMTLPVAVDTWVQAAGMRDDQPGATSGQEGSVWLTAAMSAGSGRIVTTGHPAGAPTSLADGTGTHRSFFALRLPVDGAVGLQGQLVVVFLPLHTVGTAMVPGQGFGAPQYLPDHAVLAAGCSFSLASATEPDLPLTWVNDAFTAMTGYLPSEVVGRNCRFLQGPGTEADQVTLLREELAAGRDVTAVMLNYRKDGTAFCNQVSISPVRDATGTITHFFGVQTDVTDRVEADRARVFALAGERAARADADSARRQAHVLGLRMSLVAEATGLLASTLDVDESLDRLARLAVPLLADWVVITLVDERGRTTGRSIIRHRDGREELLERYRRLLPNLNEPASASYDVLAGGPARLTPRWSAAPATGPATAAPSPAEQELLRIELELGSTSRVLVPLVARRKVVGTMLLVHGSSGRTFDDSDLDLAADLGLRAGLAIDNARMYTREQVTAVELQRSLLPSLPRIDGLEIAADYLPAGQGSQVGGDWWDVFVLPDGAIGLAVGDVMGHDIAAAAAMGQLRSVLRACAWSGDGPAAVLTRMDQLVQSFDLAQLATCFFARLEPAGEAEPGDPARLSWSSAGHLPPVVLDPAGSAQLLGTTTDVPIGVPFGGVREQHVVGLPTGSTLLLYTDGLVETRGSDIDSDVERLRTAVGRHAPAAGPQALVDALLAGLGQLPDDVALLAARILR